VKVDFATRMRFGTFSLLAGTIKPDMSPGSILFAQRKRVLRPTSGHQSPLQSICQSRRSVRQRYRARRRTIFCFQPHISLAENL
jgi:hypothetical protein